MNSSILTNTLLIALVAVNGILLIGLVTKSVHNRCGHNFAMRFNRRHHGEFAFRHILAENLGTIVIQARL